jgi:hypothetical protein
MSWVIAMSMLAITNSPAFTVFPEAFEKIFSEIVIAWSVLVDILISL